MVHFRKIKRTDTYDIFQQSFRGKTGGLSWLIAFKHEKVEDAGSKASKYWSLFCIRCLAK